MTNPFRWSSMRVQLLLAASLLAAGEVAANDRLDVLLADYRAHGLPLPPDKAALALRRPGWRQSSNGVEEIVHYLAFVEKPTNAKEKGSYWIGCDRLPFTTTAETFDAVPAASATLSKSQPVSSFDLPRGFPTNPDLALAIQCKARGWDELARQLLERAHNPPRDARSSFSQRPSWPRDDRKALALLAWNHWSNRFADAEADQAEVLRRLNTLLAGPFGLDNKARRTIVADMQATLVKRKAPGGSLEAAIERLLDLDFTGHG